MATMACRRIKWSSRVTNCERSPYGDMLMNRITYIYSYVQVWEVSMLILEQHSSPMINANEAKYKLDL